MFCTFLFGQKGTQKGHPPLNTPKRREGALIKLLYYCSAVHLSPDFLH